MTKNSYKKYVLIQINDNSKLINPSIIKNKYE